MPTDIFSVRDIGSIIKSEAPGNFSRDKITVLAGQELAVGTVLGKVTVGTVPTTVTVTGTGNGTCTAVTGGIGVQVGTYTITCTEVVTHGGVFEVLDPNYKHIGTAIITPGAGTGTSVFVSDEINFTLTDGSTDFIVGDVFSLVVPAGGLQYRAVSFAAVDGSAKAVGILGPNAVDAGASGDRTVSYTSGGTYELQPGDIITGATGGATGRVISVTLTSGTFAAGTAAGVITLDGQVGTFQSENLNVGANLNVGTIGANSAAVAAADTAGVMFARNCEYIDDYLTWPAGATAAQKALAKSQMAVFGIIERDAA